MLDPRYQGNVSPFEQFESTGKECRNKTWLVRPMLEQQSRVLNEGQVDQIRNLYLLPDNQAPGFGGGAASEDPERCGAGVLEIASLPWLCKMEST